MKEIFKDIPGYEGLYQVSNTGQVRSLRFNKIKLLSQLKHDQGYRLVCLWKNKTGAYKYVHRLIAETFIPNHCNKNEVNHLDGNKSNNYLTNIEWVTSRENNRHARAVGLNNQKGESHHWTKLTSQQVAEIRILNKSKPDMTASKIATLFQVHEATIRRIVKNRSRILT